MDKRSMCHLCWYLEDISSKDHILILTGEDLLPIGEDHLQDTEEEEDQGDPLRDTDDPPTEGLDHRDDEDVLPLDLLDNLLANILQYMVSRTFLNCQELQYHFI